MQRFRQSAKYQDLCLKATLGQAGGAPGSSVDKPKPKGIKKGAGKGKNPKGRGKGGKK